MVQPLPLIQFSVPTPSKRALEIIRALDPVHLAQVLLDFASIVASQFWDGRRTGPDFVVPMASLTKRQSGHLARLLLRHSKSLANSELAREDTLHQKSEPQGVTDAGVVSPPHSATPGNAVSPYQQVRSQAVAVLDFDIPHRRLESEYSTQADIDLMILVPILLSLLVILRTRQWSPASKFIVIDFVAALILGPGTLTLIRRTTVQPEELDPDFGSAVLMDDDFTLVIRGSPKIVEAVTEGGFYLSFSDPQSTQDVVLATESSQEKEVVSDILFGILEGGCRGVCEAIVMRLLHLHAAIPYFKEVASVVVVGRMMIKACWLGLDASTNDSLPPVPALTKNSVPLVGGSIKGSMLPAPGPASSISLSTDDPAPPVSGVRPLRSVARLTGELLGLLVVAACIESAASATLLLHGVSFFVQSSYFGLFARLVLQSQNYLIRTERLLDALNRPSIKKWSFHTPASAATFVSLVLCRDIPRPVKNINVLGLLDILIPDERDIPSVWKERVADRIVHENPDSERSINFAPTIPTFRDRRRQAYLEYLLEEAQAAYSKYHHFFPVSHYPSTMAPPNRV